MDFKTLSRVVADGVAYLPAETRQQILDTVEAGLEKALEVFETVEEAFAPVANKPSTSIYDDVRNDVGDPPGSFEDIVKNFERGVAEPDAESGGSQSLNTLLGTVYDYVVEHHEEWYDARFGDYRDDNIQHPEYLLSALEELIARRDQGNSLPGV